jgi:plasmid stability protein
MTVTVKLDAAMEEQLRQRAAGTGRSTSEIIRAALLAYLSQSEHPAKPSAFALGRDLFGRHAGEPGLAEGRKQHLVDAWAGKHSARR